MKITLVAMVLMVSFSASAYVNSKNCPDSFTITYRQVNKSPITAAIESSWYVKNAWDTLVELPVAEKTFKIVTRTNSALCVYASEGTVASFLQTNNGIDEIMVPYNYYTYFRTKVRSFSRQHIEISTDEESRNLIAPMIEIDSDGGTYPTGEVKIGQAESAEITNVK